MSPLRRDGGDEGDRRGEPMRGAKKAREKKEAGERGRGGEERSRIIQNRQSGRLWK